MNRTLAWFLGGGLLVALLLAGVVSNFASGSPDGLAATALKGCTVDSEGEITGGTCMARQEQDHQLKDGPLADYGIKGLTNPLSTGLAGVAGVLVTFAVGGGLFWLLRRRGAFAGDDAPAESGTVGDSGATVGAGTASA